MLRWVTAQRTMHKAQSIVIFSDDAQSSIAPAGVLASAASNPSNWTCQFFHHVHDVVVGLAGQHPVRLVKLLAGFRYARLVGDRDHTHPAAQQAQRVHRVEALRAARYLHHRQRAALRGTHGAIRQGQPVNLVLEHARHRAVRFGSQARCRCRTSR